MVSLISRNMLETLAISARVSSMAHCQTLVRPLSNLRQDRWVIHHVDHSFSSSTWSLCRINHRVSTGELNRLAMEHYSPKAVARVGDVSLPNRFIYVASIVHQWKSGDNCFVINLLTSTKPIRFRCSSASDDALVRESLVHSIRLSVSISDWRRWRRNRGERFEPVEDVQKRFWSKRDQFGKLERTVADDR